MLKNFVVPIMRLQCARIEQDHIDCSTLEFFRLAAFSFELYFFVRLIISVLRGFTRSAPLYLRVH